MQQRPLRFNFDDVLLNEKEFRNVAAKLKNYLIEMQSSRDLSKPFCSINLPLDRQMLQKVKVLVKEKLNLKPKLLVVIGIGGSNLGAMAIQEAVLGKDYNLMNHKIKVLYLDTVDPDAFSRNIKIIEYFLSQNQKILINIISKSGTTIETIANFEIVLKIMEKYDKEYRDSIVITTDKGSKLWKYGEKQKISLLEIPKNVGGRYSVFSPVGLFPLGILGISLNQLIEGAKQMRQRCLDLNLNKNPALLSAAAHYSQLKKGRKISDLFFFSVDLESLGKWNRQLIAESLGKKGRGITPTYSIGSIDLHSVAQLYLEGANDKLITFVKVVKFNTNFRVPENKELGYVKEIQRKTYTQLMNAIIEGTKNAFKKSKKPFIEILLPDKSPFSIAQFMQFKMFETMFLAKLLNVNAFDQPAVEIYKKETRRLLE